MLLWMKNRRLNCYWIMATGIITMLSRQHRTFAFCSSSSSRWIQAAAFQGSSSVTSRRRRMRPLFFTSVSSTRPSHSLPGSFSLRFESGRPRCLTRSFSSVGDDNDRPSEDSKDSFFALMDFESLGIQSPVLLERLRALGLERPTAVQAAVYQRLADPMAASDDESPSLNTILGAETGSGKTLAYLLPLLDDILQRKASDNDLGYDYARVLILVPNKELVQQLVRMALPLTGGARSLLYDGGNPAIQRLVQEAASRSNNTTSIDDKDVVRLAVVPGGLNEPLDFPPFRATRGLTATGREAPVDILISTPASLGPLGRQPKHLDLFADIATLVVDEADLLLDGGYIRELENVLMGFRRADRLHHQQDEEDAFRVNKTQHVFSAATLPDFGLRSVDAYLKKKFPDATRVTIDGMHQASHSGLAEPTIWIQENSKKRRMEQLVEMLQTPPSDSDDSTIGLKGQKVMIFLSSVDNVEGATQALQRAGIDNALPYHAKIKLNERTEILDRFRRYRSGSDNNDPLACPILVCTDLASRGLDLPDVDCVVQLQFAGNVVAHLHRMGRCGRAGQQTGRGVVFYGEQEAELVAVVQAAERKQKQMVLEGDVMDLEDEAEGNKAPAGSVKKAFSRRRGFTRKRKKLRKEAAESNEVPNEISDCSG